MTIPMHQMEGEPVAYVVDTNVLLHDPRALFAFKEHDIIIPMTVIEEIDNFKKDLNELGRNARRISRYLDELRAKGSLREGVKMPGGGVLRVDFSPTAEPELPITWGKETNDNRILRTVMRLERELAGNVAFITRDTNMRLKCDAMGVKAEDYQNAHIDIDEQYSGICECTVSAACIDELYANGHLSLDHVEAKLYPQQIALLSALDQPGKTAMGRVDKAHHRIKLVGRHKEGVWGIFARNKEQLFALDLLLDDSVHLVTLNGMAGTGKTLLAIACGLKRVADDRTHRKLLVSRPIFPMGRDLGFLPGDLEQKLNPWMKPIFDNLEFLLSTRHERAGRDPEYTFLLDQKIIEVEPLTYIRGRSIPQQFLIIDEAQNLTPHEVKTVLTRAGEGTKVVMTGDPNQIDHPYVDELSNGLTYAVERFKDSDIAGHVTLRKGERSELAELAARLM
jgi:PhoH-like ATPase